jgi:hypothetical protein
MQESVGSVVECDEGRGGDSERFIHNKDTVILGSPTLECFSP